jgi:hypothetical protein
MRKSWLLLFFFLTFTAKAQEIYSLENDLSIQIDGKTLASPFAGGINSAQIQTIDLNVDGQEEWVVWDINSRQLQVFEKSEDQFTHLPELSYFFPSDIAGFLTLADYDGDGKKDLFTATALGIKAYRNTSQGTRISWALAQNFLRLDGSGNIQVNNLDTPLIQDLDGDGDLDLVIFNFAAGDYLEFYKNTSMERKGIPDMDGFAFPVRFWGNFVFCGCGNFTFGQTCTGSPIAPNARTETNQRIQHAGGHSILYRDFDGDGVSDLVLGRDECNSLFFLSNQGTEVNPLFNSFEKSLPEFGAFPEFPRFHIGQLIQDQFIISLNTNEAASNYTIDFEQSIVDFKANGNSDFGYLQKNMLDLGENSRPFFKGNKNGGELILSANVTSNQKVQAQLTRFSFVNGVFKLLESNYLNLASQNLLDVQYLEFQDAQNQAFQLISGVRIENNIPRQQLFRLLDENLAPLRFSGYDPRVGDYLQFFKTGEREDFLLVARQNGGLDLYQINFNLATATLVAKDFLGFQDNPATRNLTIAVSGQTQPDLFTVDQNGKILKIADFMNIATRSAVLLEIGNQNLESRLGRNTWIAPINPLFEEGPDLLLGTRAGGIIYLKAIENSNPSEGEYQVKVYPNPSDGPIKIISNLPAIGRLVNAMGQILLDEIAIPANSTVEIQAGFLTPGLYILNLEVDGRFRVSRKIWIR